MNDLPIINGTLVCLRPLVASDAEAMYASLQNEETMRLTGSHATFTLDAVRSFCASVASDDCRADFIIELLDTPDVAQGEVVLNDIDRDNDIANFRIALYDTEQFSKGMGTEATRLIAEFGFQELGLHKIELEVFAFNPRAQHVYEKVGFVREGIRRDALLWQEQRVDAITMGLLRHEFMGTATLDSKTKVPGMSSKAIDNPNNRKV